MGSDRERESERKGKKGRAIGVEEEPAEEAVACGLCGDPLVEGETGSREPRGSYHAGCIRWARRMALGERDPGAQEPAGVRRRRRRS